MATGASITGFVRAYLWRHICAVKKGGGQPVYCDTDSIAFIWPKKAGKMPFGLSKELGDWTYEGRYDFGAIGGKKLYAFHADKATAARNKAAWKQEHPDDTPDADDTADMRWKTACKGVQLDPEEIVTVAKGGEVTYRRDAPSMRVGTKGSMMTFVERTVKRTGKTP